MLVVVWESSVIFLPPARLRDFEEKPRRVVFLFWFFLFIFFLRVERKKERKKCLLAGPVSAVTFISPFPPCSAEREKSQKEGKLFFFLYVRGIVPFPWKSQPSSHLTSVHIPKNSLFFFSLSFAYCCCCCWIFSFMDLCTYSAKKSSIRVLPPSGPSGIGSLSLMVRRRMNDANPSAFNSDF